MLPGYVYDVLTHQLLQCQLDPVLLADYLLFKVGQHLCPRDAY
jgi:hypothetical protein